MCNFVGLIISGFEVIKGGIRKHFKFWTKKLLFERLDFVISAFTAKAGRKQLNPFTVIGKIVFIADYKVQTVALWMSLVHLGFGAVVTLCGY